jgi:uncharacterized membrane protein
MKVINPLQLSDLNIKSFLKIILVVQLALLGVIGLDAVGLQLPILRQIIGFIYLTFVPGAIILRILKIHNIDKTKFVLYSAGLSIAFVMFAGALINSLLPALKISQPISTLPLTVAFSIFIALLCVAAYIRDREFQPSEIEYNTNNLVSPSYLFLLLLPFIAVFGTFFINFYQNNTLSLLLLFLIAVIAALIAFDKFIPAKAYPLAIYAIALSLVFHVSLISPYPLAWNIDTEYYFSELIATSGYWDSSLSSGVNSLLSIIMLAPIYSKMLGINMIWFLKAISPFIHALLPLAIFAACREQMEAKKAFFSSFFYMSLSGFFALMILFRREQIATVFLALLVLVMLDKKLTSIQKSALAIAFVISLPVSHYGTSYLSMGILSLGMVLLYITSNKQTIFNKRISKKTNGNNTENVQKNITQPSILKLGIILVWFVFMLSWFMYIAGGRSFNNYVHVIENSFLSLNNFFKPESTPEVVYGALGMGLQSVDVLGWLFRIVHYSTEVFIVVGAITLILRPKIFKLKEEYRALLIVTALFLFTIMFLPAMGKSWNTGRFYNFVLIIIAPLIVFGCEAIWKLTSWLIKSALLPLINKLKRHKSPIVPRYHNRNNQVYLKFLVLFILVPYFLFNTGFIYEISGESKSSRLVPWKIDTGYFNEREVSGAEWLDGVSGERTIVAGDGTSCSYLLSLWFRLGSSRRSFGISLKREVPKSAYIYLRTWNIEKQEVIVYHGIRGTSEHINPEDIPVLRDAINIRNKIYDNAGAQVFAPPG